MTWQYLLTILSYLSLSSALYDSTSDVKLLSHTNFNKFIKRHPIALVEFYAPWCGHCKNLAPEYSKAAKSLKDIVPLAAVDADDKTNSLLASKYEIKSFPTLFLFKNGKHSEFNHRSADAIIKALKSELPDNHLTLLSSDNSDEFFALSKPKVVFFSNSDKPDAFFKSISLRFYKHLRFAFVAKSQEQLFQKHNISSSKILYFEEKSKSSKELSKSPSTLREEISKILGPSVDAFEKLDILHDQSCLERYCVSTGMLCVFYVEAGDKTAIINRRTVLQEAREELVDDSFFKFVRVDAATHRDFLRTLFGEKVALKFPRVFLVSFKKKLFSPFKQEFTRDNLANFMSGFVQNKPSQRVVRFRATEMPKMKRGDEKCPPLKKKSRKSKEEPGESLVIPLTPTNFEKTLSESRVPVFVEFYAPWCGHCKQFAPVYERIAKKMGNTVLFTKVDAAEHREFGQSHGVKGFPTIKYIAGKVDRKNLSLTDYSESRSEDAVIAKAKALLKESAKLAKLTEGLDFLGKELEKFQWIALMADDSAKTEYVRDALAVYFAMEKSVSFRQLANDGLKESLKVGKSPLVLVGRNGEKMVLQRYKGRMEFDALVRDLERVIKGDKKAEERFDYEEISSGEKSEL